MARTTPCLTMTPKGAQLHRTRKWYDMAIFFQLNHAGYYEKIVDGKAQKHVLVNECTKEQLDNIVEKYTPWGKLIRGHFLRNCNGTTLGDGYSVIIINDRRQSRAPQVL